MSWLTLMLVPGPASTPRHLRWGRHYWLSPVGFALTPRRQPLGGAVRRDPGPQLALLTEGLQTSPH